MRTKVLNRIQELRVAYNRRAEPADRLTQADLADKLGISRPHLSDIENQRVRNITTDILEALIDIFDIQSFDEIFEKISVKDDEEDPGNVLTSHYQQEAPLPNFA